jgi:hypothetical protein
MRCETPNVQCDAFVVGKWCGVGVPLLYYNCHTAAAVGVESFAQYFFVDASRWNHSHVESQHCIAHVIYFF